MFWRKQKKKITGQVHFGYLGGGGSYPFSSSQTVDEFQSVIAAEQRSKIRSLFVQHFKAIFPFENAKLIEFRKSNDVDLLDNTISPYWIRFVVEFNDIDNPIHFIYYAKDEIDCSRIREVILSVFKEL